MIQFLQSHQSSQKSISHHHCILNQVWNSFIRQNKNAHLQRFGGILALFQAWKTTLIEANKDFMPSKEFKYLSFEELQQLYLSSNLKDIDCASKQKED